MLGLKIGLFLLWYWQSDVQTTRLDLIFKLKTSPFSYSLAFKLNLSHMSSKSSLPVFLNRLMIFLNAAHDKSNTANDFPKRAFYAKPSLSSALPMIVIKQNKDLPKFNQQTP
jgi:hypothetical protein